METSHANQFQVRRYRLDDIATLRQLFFQTIHTVNRQHYSEEQVNAWAPREYDEAQWADRIAKINPFVCIHQQQIVGYAGLLEDGYIDHFYVHHQWQGRGVGSRLMREIETTADELNLDELTSDVSITARPFFETWGFVVVRPQTAERDGIHLSNFRMRKNRATQTERRVMPT